MTKEELKKAIAKKQELVRKLEVYQMTKGLTLPTGKDVNQSIIALQKQIKEHEYELEHGNVLSDDEVIAIARGENYMTASEKEKNDSDKAFVRSLLGFSSEEEVNEIREMIKTGC